MPTHSTDTQIRLKMLCTCFTVTVNTLGILANSIPVPFIMAISNTTQSLLKNLETVRKNKGACIELMEQTHGLLNAIIILHVKSETGVLPPSVLYHIGKFTETLYKIHNFIEFQQSGSKVKQFFRQGEMNTLLKDCKNGLTQGLDVFRLENTGIMTDVSKMQADTNQRHQEVLDMINGLSDIESSDRASTMSRVYSLSHNSKVELAALIGAHLGLKPSKDLTQAVVKFLVAASPSLLILDNLETVWEPTELRGDIEEFLSLLTDLKDLALIITMRGSGGPAKTTCLLLSILLHTWWMWRDAPVYCPAGRIKAVPHAQELLSLLSMLPDGLSDIELIQSNLLIVNILACKAALIRTALAYLDEKKQLKALVPIREYMQRIHPPRNDLVKPLFKHFHELLELYKDFYETEMNSATVGRISSNLANIQSLLQNGLQKDHPDLMDNVFSVLYLNIFSRITG
ncbi:hypothetical protein K438DRAFT_1939153 [Mycena galopus ATCC 62051]|nr:hypothetical protein K438DRAFT_1939153 [Mycena galopus ATCC 62051]